MTFNNTKLLQKDLSELRCKDPSQISTMELLCENISAKYFRKKAPSLMVNRAYASAHYKVYNFTKILLYSQEKF